MDDEFEVELPIEEIEIAPPSAYAAKVPGSGKRFAGIDGDLASSRRHRLVLVIRGLSIAQHRL